MFNIVVTREQTSGQCGHDLAEHKASFRGEREREASVGGPTGKRTHLASTMMAGRQDAFSRRLTLIAGMPLSVLSVPPRFTFVLFLLFADRFCMLWLVAGTFARTTFASSLTRA